jgi:hypothetical protein
MRSRALVRQASLAVAGAMALGLAAGPLHAAEPVFPTGSRIGLVPPPGMIASTTFDGFADPTKDAAIIITMLPASAYPEIEKSVASDELKKHGITVETREPIKLDLGPGFLILGSQANANKARFRKWILVADAKDLTAVVNVQIPEGDTVYTDAAVRAALLTLAMRGQVPEAELLSLLPFVVGDLASFHIGNVLPGRALMLVDDADGTLNARLMIAALAGGPTEADDRANFARRAFDTIAGIKDVRFTMSEPLRIGGQQGYQTMAQAKDGQSDEDIMVVQWLRFGSGGFMQMVGISRAETWVNTLARLRTVRDSVEPK